MKWIDKATSLVAPRWTLRRLQARAALDVAQRHYEGASVGRRTQGWNRARGDANAVIGPALSSLRASARDLVRNNSYAESALRTIVNHAVGWGLEGKPVQPNARVLDLWRAWAESTACDADGRQNFSGLTKLVMRTVVESGEVLVRRRMRYPEDGLPIPLQIQVLDPDFLDTSKDTATGLPGSGGNVIIQGVEFDGLGRRVAYHLFREHPGSAAGAFPSSVRVPAESVLHIFKVTRPGQVRGPSWFAPTLLRFKEFDEFEDATLMKQKIAACLAAIVTDPDGTPTGVGNPDPTTPGLDRLYPGAVLTAPPGREVSVVNPPAVDEYEVYTRSVLRAIATGLGVTYEDLTGDYADMPFSAARMSRVEHWSNVEDWRWQLLVPQFCDPVWAWAMQAAAMANLLPADWPKARWSAPPAPMVDPANEGLALQRIVRNGLDSLSNVLRERGYDPDEILGELSEDFKKLDALGLTLDIDPRRMTQAGQQQPPPKTEPEAPPAGAAGTSDDDTERGARLLVANKGWSAR